MSEFNSVLVDKLRVIEGNESNNPSDHGGRTKFGLSQRSYPSLNFDTLTFDDAIPIFKKDFWEKYRLNEIVDQGMAEQLFFMIINMDPKQAIFILQIAIIAIEAPEGGVQIDGILGSATIATVNKLSGQLLSNRLRLELINFYLSITDKDPSQIEFFRGWVRRALTQ